MLRLEIRLNRSLRQIFERYERELYASLSPLGETVGNTAPAPMASVFDRTIGNSNFT